MRRVGGYARRGVAVTLLTGALTPVAALHVSASEPSSSSRADALAVVARALQVSDDAVYLPVQLHGRWTLASPGSWLQPSISTTSSPWRWTAARCTVFDSSLVPGMEAFMQAQIAATFGGLEEARLTTAFEAKAARLGTAAACVRPPGAVTVGPPGPIRDRTTVTKLSVSGTTATAAGVVHVTDWQGGVTHVPTAHGGRLVGWAVVPGMLDTTYRLVRGHKDGWRVVALTARFAPGSGP